jgi:hypothetical protein
MAAEHADKTSLTADMLDAVFWRARQLLYGELGIR